MRSIKSKNAISKHCTGRQGNGYVSNKTIAVSTAIIVISLVALAAILAETYATLQSINPVAAIAAAAVVIIGLVWFKKASKS